MNHIKEALKDKNGDAYIWLCVIVVFISMLLSVLILYMGLLSQVQIQKRDKQDWSDVLAAKVERIYDGAYGTQIEVSGCPAHRLRDFSFALAGYCSEEQWSRWFNEPTANTEALTMG